MCLSIISAVPASGTMRFETAMIANHALTVRMRVVIPLCDSLSLKDFAGPSPPARLAGTCLPARLSGCDPHCWMCVHVVLCCAACLQVRQRACRRTLGRGVYFLTENKTTKGQAAIFATHLCRIGRGGARLNGMRQTNAVREGLVVVTGRAQTAHGVGG